MGNSEDSNFEKNLKILDNEVKSLLPDLERKEAIRVVVKRLNDLNQEIGLEYRFFVFQKNRGRSDMEAVQKNRLDLLLASADEMSEIYHNLLISRKNT